MAIYNRVVALLSVAAFALSACSAAPTTQIPAFSQVRSMSQQTGETLLGTSPHRHCGNVHGYSGSVTTVSFVPINVTGTAKGKYPGTFTVEGWWQFDRRLHKAVELSETLSITSGARTIDLRFEAHSKKFLALALGNCNAFHMSDVQVIWKPAAVHATVDIVNSHSTGLSFKESFKDL